MSDLPDTTRRTRLLLVDDHTLFRCGLRALLAQDGRFEVIAEAGDVGEALRCVAQRSPDVVLLDNHLPGVRGVESIPAFKEAAPGIHILMLTVSENEEDLAAALQAGADGYLLKTVESDQLCEAIVKVHSGESVVSPEMMSKLVSAFRSQGAPSSQSAGPRAQAPGGQAWGAATDTPLQDSGGIGLLSPRERQILVLIARGNSNKLIARELDIAETTVKIHVQHILRKLELNSRVQAAVYATSCGLV